MGGAGYDLQLHSHLPLLSHLITLLKNHGQVDGLSWWYAEANAKGCTGNLKTGWYNASLFDNETGRALPALYELKNFAEGSAGISDAQRSTINVQRSTFYDLQGRQLSGKPSWPGIYIHNGRKIVVK